MDTVTAPCKRLSRRIPGVGTPYRVGQRRRKVEKFLRHDAAALRSHADHLEWIAGRLGRDREAGLDADRMHLCRAARASAVARRFINELIGIDRWAQLDECLDAIVPRSRVALSASEASPSTDPRRTSVPALEPSTPTTAIGEAMAIAQSVATDGSRPPDWSRAPLTERERRIRAKLLEHAEEDVSNGRWASSIYGNLGAKPHDGGHHLTLDDDCDHLYDDILASWRRARAIEAHRYADLKADSRRQAFDDAIAAIDDEDDGPREL